MQEFLMAYPFYSLVIVSVVVYGIRDIVSDLTTDAKTGEEILSSNNSDTPQAKKSVKLLSAEGTLLQEYNDVYVEYEDTNIYLLSHEYKGRCFLRIEKGSNMLLIVECYSDNEE